MFIRKNWLPLSVLLVAIVGIGLYMLATQPPPEPMKIYKTVEPKKPTQQPTTTQAPVGETSQEGHFHADGTFHAQQHETEVQSTAEVSPPQPQDSPSVIVQTPPIAEASEGEDINALYHKRLEEYFKAFSEWREKHDEAAAEWTASIEAVLDVLPEEGTPEYLQNLSDVERQELLMKMEYLVEKRKAASEKLKSVILERPVQSQNP
ncbi:hypothetical protein F4054_12420 [Candidatus Poribacteria bacterium]|nr:hypothetical protein [Candidatus Poribacteria bacterium]MYG08497.1 hypothetical protein [Candidatus Poribacteria bacterium]MYK23048.1 hypothetical protein [Candidatus Poribacteria bacterium]